jgi:hypothetical protein
VSATVDRSTLSDGTRMLLLAIEPLHIKTNLIFNEEKTMKLKLIGASIALFAVVTGNAAGSCALYQAKIDGAWTAYACMSENIYSPADSDSTTPVWVNITSDASTELNSNCTESSDMFLHNETSSNGALDAGVDYQVNGTSGSNSVCPANFDTITAKKKQMEKEKKHAVAER